MEPQDFNVYVDPGVFGYLHNLINKYKKSINKINYLNKEIEVKKEMLSKFFTYETQLVVSNDIQSITKEIYTLSETINSYYGRSDLEQSIRSLFNQKYIDVLKPYFMDLDKDDILSTNEIIDRIVDDSIKYNLYLDFSKIKIMYNKINMSGGVYDILTTIWINTSSLQLGLFIYTIIDDMLKKGVLDKTNKAFKGIIDTVSVLYPVTQITQDDEN